MHILWLNGYLPPPVARDRTGQVVFSVGIWLAAGTIMAAILYSTMTVLREQARSLRQRVRDLTLLHGIGNRVARTLDLEDVLETAVESLQSSFGYDSVVILTRPAESDHLTARAAAGKHADILPENHTQTLTEGLIGWTASHGESVLVNDVEADPRYVNHYPDWVSTQSELCVPIQAGDDVVGVLDVQSDRLDAFSEADRRTLETLAGQIGVAMENARLYQAERAARDQLRDLVSYIQSAQEDERTHIAREILDEFGQLMAALQMDLTWLRQRLNEDQTALADKTRKSSTIVDQSIQVVQRLSSELRPSVLDHFGLAAAVRWQADAFAERTGITPQLRLDVDADLVEPDLATALFRILQEAMSNVALHAEATQVFIRLRTDEQRVALIVQDNGRGIRPEEADGAHSLGLVGMRERARALDGDVNIDGIPGHGTTVTATIPRLGDQEAA
jgi:signal transduction histidine kinase